MTGFDSAYHAYCTQACGFAYASFTVYCYLFNFIAIIVIPLSVILYYSFERVFNESVIFQHLNSVPFKHKLRTASNARD